MWTTKIHWLGFGWKYITQIWPLIGIVVIKSSSHILYVHPHGLIIITHNGFVSVSSWNIKATRTIQSFTMTVQYIKFQMFHYTAHVNPLVENSDWRLSSAALHMIVLTPMLFHSLCSLHHVSHTATAWLCKIRDYQTGCLLRCENDMQLLTHLSHCFQSALYVITGC